MVGGRGRLGCYSKTSESKEMGAGMTQDSKWRVYRVYGNLRHMHSNGPIALWSGWQAYRHIRVLPERAVNETRVPERRIGRIQFFTTGVKTKRKVWCRSWCSRRDV